jgi:arylsulfatase A-like enzyme
MPARDVLLVTFDGLRASALGPYGNAWYPTPAFDRLAAESLLVEWMLCPQPAAPAATALQSLALPPHGEYSAQSALFERLQQAGASTTLVTDDPTWQAACLPHASVAYHEVASLPTAGLAAEFELTALAQWCAETIDALHAWSAASPRPASAGRLFWAHSRALFGPWDAPLAWREALCDEDDPPAPTWVEPPAVPRIDDHDELFAHRVAYAAQVQVVDGCLGALLAALEGLPRGEPPLLVVAGLRGWPLGEHGFVGPAQFTPYGEWLHTPCLLSAPALTPQRRRGLFHLGDLVVTLLDAFQVPAEAALGQSLLAEPATDDQAALRYVVARGGPTERAIRTRHWLLASAAEARQEYGERLLNESRLYAKPDDRWEFNEVANRCPEVAATLDEVLQEAFQTEPPRWDGMLVPEVDQRLARG